MSPQPDAELCPAKQIAPEPLSSDKWAPPPPLDGNHAGGTQDHLAVDPNPPAADTPEAKS